MNVKDKFEEWRLLLVEIAERTRHQNGNSRLSYMGDTVTFHICFTPLHVNNEVCFVRRMQMHFFFGDTPLLPHFFKR